MMAPPPIKTPMAAMNMPNRVMATLIRMGSRIRMSIAPSPSTAKMAPAAADGFFS